MLSILGKTWIPTKLPKIQAAWQSGKRTAMLPYYFDLIFRPTNADGTPIPEGVQSGEDATREFTTFVEKTLPSKFGVCLSLTGLRTFQLFTYIATFCGRHLVNEANLSRYATALIDSEAFDSTDIIFDPSQIVKAPEPEIAPTLEDIETSDESTPEGRLATKALVEELAEDQSLPLANLWFKSLAENYAGFQPTRDDWQYICALFQKMNWSPLEPKNYDSARRNMVSVGRWTPAEHFLTHDDLKSRACEVLNLDRETRHVIFNGSKQQLIDLLKRHGCTLA